MRELTVQVTRDAAKKPKIATFMGTKFATSTQLQHRILNMLQTGDWSALPEHTADWLNLQNQFSQMPEANRILVESFAHDSRPHTVFYGFAGRNAMQTLGLLLTQRMEEQGLGPLGFVATDYATMIWSVSSVTDPAPLFEPQGLRDGLDTWLSGNAVMKKTFRASATIAGLIERNSPQARKTGRQATFSSDILYDTLHKYDPDHLMMQITREEAMRGLVDFGRIEEMLDRTQGRVDHVKLSRVSPLAAPLLLEVGRVAVHGEGRERLMEEEAAALMEASGLNAIDTALSKPRWRVGF